jgi:hypothetical protein
MRVEKVDTFGTGSAVSQLSPARRRAEAAQRARYGPIVRCENSSNRSGSADGIERTPDANV